MELQLSADILRARSRNQVGVSADFSLAYNSNKVTGINHEITSGYEALESSSYHLGKHDLSLGRIPLHRDGVKV